MAMAHRSIGVAPLTHLALSPAQMVSNAAAAGFDGVGLRLIPATPTEPQHKCIGDTAAVRETEQRLKDSGLKVLDIEIFRLQPETRISDFEAALATGARLGARHALAAPQDAEIGRLADRLGEFCDLAARYDIRVDLEPTPWYEVRTLAETQAVIAASGRDAGILIDPIHLDRAGDTADDVRAAPARYFRYLQLCDAPAERPTDLPTLLHQARAARLMPGDGGLDLAGLLRALPADLPISLEIPMERGADAVDPVRQLKTMLAKTREFLARLD
jgi:sugar phosphate isomerase/epimerase